jgi:hypothetical protein
MPAIPDTWVRFLAHLERDEDFKRGEARLVRAFSLCALAAGGGTAKLGWEDRRPVDSDPSVFAVETLGVSQRTASRNSHAALRLWSRNPQGGGLSPLLPAWPSVNARSWWHPFTVRSADTLAKLKRVEAILALHFTTALRSSSFLFPTRDYITVSPRSLSRELGICRNQIRGALASLSRQGIINCVVSERESRIFVAGWLTSGSGGGCVVADKTQPKSGQNAAKNQPERSHPPIYNIGYSVIDNRSGETGSDELARDQNRHRSKIDAFLSES